MHNNNLSLFYIENNVRKIFNVGDISFVYGTTTVHGMNNGYIAFKIDNEHTPMRNGTFKIWFLARRKKRLLAGMNGGAKLFVSGIECQFKQHKMYMRDYFNIMKHTILNILAK